MKFAKVENNNIKEVFIKMNPIWLNGIMYSNPSEHTILLYKEELLKNGIKPIKETEKPEIIDNYILKETYIDLKDYVLKSWTLEPYIPQEIE